MPVFGNPFPDTALRTIHESSAQRSLRDSDAVPQQWKTANSNTFATYQLQVAVRQMQLAITRMKRRIVGG